MLGCQISQIYSEIVLIYKLIFVLSHVCEFICMYEYDKINVTYTSFIYIYIYIYILRLYTVNLLGLMLFQLVNNGGCGG